MTRKELIECLALPLLVALILVCWGLLALVKGAW